MEQLKQIKAIKPSQVSTTDEQEVGPISEEAKQQKHVMLSELLKKYDEISKKEEIKKQVYEKQVGNKKLLMQELHQVGKKQQMIQEMK